MNPSSQAISDFVTTMVHALWIATHSLQLEHDMEPLTLPQSLTNLYLPTHNPDSIILTQFY